MSFTNIDEIKNNDSRSFIMIYNFNSKEVANLKNICRLFGIKDIQVLSTKNADSKIVDIINNEIVNTDEQGINQKAIIFNNINSTKVSGLLDSLKKFRMNRPLTAMVTEDNVNWTVNNLLLNLLEEREALKQGKSSKH
ncbi:MAG: DUF3783 domain-containing protein [Peptostreptococcaceae bacterium]